MEKNNPGLDMKHGFLHHIRRNQLKRDEYDKEVRCKTSNSRSLKTEYAKGGKHPDKRVYKARREGDSEMEKGLSRTDNSGACGRTLYKLEYTDNTGWVHKFEVHEFDDPSSIARKLMMAAGIPKELMETLEWKIRQDIAKRNS